MKAEKVNSKSRLTPYSVKIVNLNTQKKHLTNKLANLARKSYTPHHYHYNHNFIIYTIVIIVFMKKDLTPPPPPPRNK